MTFAGLTSSYCIQFCVFASFARQFKLEHPSAPTYNLAITPKGFFRRKWKLLSANLIAKLVGPQCRHTQADGLASTRHSTESLNFVFMRISRR